MNRFQPLWNQKTIEERLIEAQKRIDKAMSNPVNYEEWLKEARRESDLYRNQQEFWNNKFFNSEPLGESIGDWVRRMVKEIDKTGPEEWIDLNLPHFSIGGVQIDFVDNINDVHHGYYDIGGFHNAKGQVVPIKCVNRWRYARVKREPAPTWKPVDLDNPPTFPVLVRHDDESTPFVVSQWFDWFHGWEYCEIPD